MRRIDRQSAFRRDFKREKLSGQHKNFDKLMVEILTLLVNDVLLPQRYCDHTLSGDMQNFRECHIKPNLLLIYAKPDSESLVLARLGSHSDLFG
jgi:mRNA interferase YafQ